MELTEKDLEKQYRDDEEDERPRYVLRNAKFALSDLPPIEWIVGTSVSEGSVNMFYGEPGSKKTYSLLSLAACVALGKPWMGLEVAQRKVLIIDEESGERRLALRIGRAMRGELGKEDTPIEFVSLTGFKLDNKSDRDELQKLIENTGAGLVIIDALTDVMDGDENSKQDTQPVFTALRRIAEQTSAAIIIIHHSNRAGGYRGSSAIKGALDLMVKIESEDDSNWITFRSEKTRDGDAMRLTAVAKWTEDQFYLTKAETTTKAKKLNNSQKYVIRHLTRHGPSPLPNIMGAADSCTPQAAKRAVYALVELGHVYRTNPNDTGRGTEAIYSLREEYQNEDDDSEEILV